jgi:DNA-binding transcriptional regulator YiaG
MQYLSGINLTYLGIVCATLMWYHGRMEPEEVIRRRTALGFSRRELAREIGVDQATVWRWEVERRKPTAAIGRLLDQTLRRLERRKGIGRGDA